MSAGRRPACNLAAFRPAATAHAQDDFAAYLRNQVEFYFSDANLLHDRFLRSRVWRTRKGYVALKELCRFNKIRQVLKAALVEPNRYIATLAQALEGSTALKLNKPKNQVKRVSRFSIVAATRPPACAERERRLIYVEQVPQSWTLDDVYSKFSAHGHIVRVELPRYDERRNKTYAFIEFSCGDEAEKALAGPAADALRCLSMADFKGVKAAYTTQKCQALQAAGYIENRLPVSTYSFFTFTWSAELGAISRAYLQAIFKQIGIPLIIVTFNPPTRRAIVAVTDKAGAEAFHNDAFEKLPLTNFIEAVRPLQDFDPSKLPLKAAKRPKVIPTRRKVGRPKKAVSGRSKLIKRK